MVLFFGFVLSSFVTLAYCYFIVRFLNIETKDEFDSVFLKTMILTIGSIVIFFSNYFSLFLFLFAVAFYYTHKLAKKHRNK